MGSPGAAAVAAIVLVATAGVIVRPWRTPEALWAVAGAVLLVATGLLPLADAGAGLGRSLDVCLFLAGMMLLAETARREGLFDALASARSIAATFVVLRWTERAALAGGCEPAVIQPRLMRGGWTPLAGLAGAVAVLLAVSAMNRPLGAPTAAMGVAVAALSLVARRASPLPLLRAILWSILPLVAGLFVMVEAVDRIGVADALAAALRRAAAASLDAAPWAAGAVVALGGNLMNNLPAGLLAAQAAALARAPRRIVDALLIGVDLGPNLWVTGSPATILWLAVVRREGQDVSAWRFLKTGLVVMPPALILALAARFVTP